MSGWIIIHVSVFVSRVYHRITLTLHLYPSLYRHQFKSQVIWITFYIVLDIGRFNIERTSSKHSILYPLIRLNRSSTASLSFDDRSPNNTSSFRTFSSPKNCNVQRIDSISVIEIRDNND